MIHSIYKSHDGQFQFYCELDFNGEDLSVENYVLHLKPNKGGELSIDSPAEILEFVDLVRSVYDGEQCAGGTILEDFDEQEIEDIFELINVINYA